MATKRPDMQSLGKKTLGDPAVREEYEALDPYYKTKRQLTAMLLKFRNLCTTIIADIADPQAYVDIIEDSLLDTILEISDSPCLASDDIARQEHLCEAARILEKNLQDNLERRLNQQGVTNKDAPDD